MPITRRFCVQSVHTGSSKEAIKSALRERGLSACIGNKNKSRLLSIWREDRIDEQMRINESMGMIRQRKDVS